MSNGAGTGDAGGLPPSWPAVILDQMLDGVAIADLDGQVVYANPSVELMLGWTQDELRALSLFERIHPEDLPRAARSLVSVSEGARPLPGVFRVATAAGGWKALEVTGTGLDVGTPDDPHPVLSLLLRDASLNEAHWQFITAVSGGEQLHESIQEFARGLSSSADGCLDIVYDGGEGYRETGAPHSQLQLLDGHGQLLGGPDTPWRRVLEKGGREWATLDELDPVWAEAARSIGAAAVVAVAAPNPLGLRPSLLVQWTPTVQIVAVQLESLVRRPSQAISLALERVDAVARLERMASRDPLTGLANRARLHRDLEEHLTNGRNYAICFVDLDGFKAVNDRYGHAFGDRVLVEVAHRMTNVAGPESLVARLGGDEFVVRCPSLAEARRIATAIVLTLSTPVIIDEAVAELGASVGISSSTDADTPDGVVASADLALYTAKQEGRGRWVRRTPR